MRAKGLTLASFAAGLVAALGCHHDKYKLAAPQVEEYKLPPDEARYSTPPTENYRPPPPKKDDTSLMGGRNKMGGGRGMPGGGF